MADLNKLSDDQLFDEMLSLCSRYGRAGAADRINGIIAELKRRIASMPKDGNPENEEVETLLCPKDVGTSTMHYDGGSGVNKGVCCGCGCTKDEHRLVTAAHLIDVEQARWQEAIRGVVLCGVKDIPESFRPIDIDGSGCDSGDPLDLSLAEVQQGLNAWSNYVYDTRGANKPKLEPDQIMLADGRIKKVLGTLRETKDGYIIGDDVNCYYPAFDGEISETRVQTGPLWDLWSTHEAAEAARAKEGENG